MSTNTITKEQLVNSKLKFLQSSKNPKPVLKIVDGKYYLDGRRFYPDLRTKEEKEECRRKGRLYTQQSLTRVKENRKRVNDLWEMYEQQANQPVIPVTLNQQISIEKAVLNAKIRSEIRKSREAEESEEDSDDKMTDTDYRNAYLGSNINFDE